MEESKSLTAARPMRAVQIRMRTNIQERTELLTNGSEWQIQCSCGFHSRVFKRKQTALRHFAAHATRPT